MSIQNNANPMRVGGKGFIDGYGLMDNRRLCVVDVVTLI